MISAEVRKNWGFPLVGLLVALLLISIMYGPTFIAMVDVWLSSDTYAHGFFILPISIWLVWRKRVVLAVVRPAPDYRFALLLPVIGSGWLVAAYIDVQVIQQLAVVAMIVVACASMLGWVVSKIILFPLLFLFFSVPIGEELVPYLIDFTADFAVLLIQFIGIPIYQEGSYIQLPTGNWSVVKACSGVRYLISSAVLGLLYAHLNYTKLWKKILFCVVALVVPIIANGLRAVMIMMIGHYSDMTLATGVDHLIYGWVFFGFVMAVMFYMGSFFVDTELPTEIGVEKENEGIANNRPDGKMVRGSLVTSVLVMLFISIWPVKYNGGQIAVDPEVELSEINLPGWNVVDELTAWRPKYKNLDAEQVVTYQKNGKKVMLYLGYYHVQRQEAELVNYSNVLVEESSDIARLIENKSISFDFDGRAIAVPRFKLDVISSQYEVMKLFYVYNHYLTGGMALKLAQAKNMIVGAPNYGVLVLVASDYEQNGGNIFLEENYSYIQKHLETMYAEY